MGTPSHESRADSGRPHVTDIMRDAGLVTIDWFTEEARDRGTAVHLATRYLDEGDLDRSSLDASVAPRLEQYERFLAEVKPTIVDIERTVEHDTLGYVGTLDRTLTIAGRVGVLDIKGTLESPWHGVQLAAYAACVGGPLARWNLYLHDTRYKLVERRERTDWEVFKAAITIASWRNLHV